MKYLIQSNKEALKRDREAHLSRTFLTLFPKETNPFPDVLLNLIKGYSDEGVILTLSDMEIAKLALIEFGFLLAPTANLTQGVNVTVGANGLPNTVLQLQQEMKLPAKERQAICPSFTNYYDANSAGYFHRNLTLISTKTPENYQKGSLKNQLDNKDLKFMDNITITEYEDEISNIIYFSPFQMILKLEKAKDAHYENVISQNFSSESIITYLHVVKNLENFKRLYKNYLGYLDIATFKTVILPKEMTIDIYTHVSPSDVRDTPKDVLKGLKGIPCIMRALIASKIRCSQIGVNGYNGYCGLIGKESMGTFLAIPGVREHYQPKLYVDDSLTGRELVTEVMQKIANQGSVTQQSKLDVLTHLVRLLQYVYHDPASTYSEFQTIQDVLSQSDHKMTVFLQKRRQFQGAHQFLGSTLGFESFKGNTPTFDIARQFVALRQREAAQIFPRLQEKMPDQYAKVFTTNSSSSSASSPSSSSN